jgi:hypothetical protein
MTKKYINLTVALTILYVMMFSVIQLNACDMMAMIAKNGYSLSDLPSIENTYNDPYDFIQFLKDRSTNSYASEKKNPDGYGVLYYKENGAFYLDPAHLGHTPGNQGDPNNQAWYQVGHNTYYTGGSTDWKWELETAQDKIMTPGANAIIVMGHTRHGTGGNGNHPFRCEYMGKTFTFMHNGGLGFSNAHSIKQVLLAELINDNWFASGNHPSNWEGSISNINSWIDSEILFNWIMKNIEECNGNIIEGIHQALTTTLFYEGDQISLESVFHDPYKDKSEWHNCVNFILSDGENLYVFKNGNNSDTEHQLFLQTNLNGFYSINTYISPQENTSLNQYDFVKVSRDGVTTISNFLTKDIKTYSPGWNWISFPRLEQQGTYSGNYDPLIGEQYQQAYFENGLPGLYQTEENGPCTVPNLTEVDGWRDGLIKLQYHNNGNSFPDIGFENQLYRSEGFKIHIQEGTDPTTSVVEGNRLTSYSLDMPQMETFWLGYYLPYSQNIKDAFGSNWSKVNKVWAQDWYYDSFHQERGIGTPVYPANSTIGKTMKYGKMYIVQMHEDVSNFSWCNSNLKTDPPKREEPQSFAYTEKANYEAIDVLNIPSDVTEIGVYENNKCVGAVCVQDTSAQILVYSDDANRETLPFSFEFVSGRGKSIEKDNYLVLNKYTGKFESSVIYAGQQRYSVVRFDSKTKPENSIEVPKLNKNYPNPFKLSETSRGIGTTISFSLPKNDIVDLSIYNIKGQKVKSLYSGPANKGKHSLIWSGNNTNNKQVGSGIYFYKLKTSKTELTRKMLILK